MTNLCDVCGKPATQSMLRDPFGKSNGMRFVCSDHGFRIRDPADVAEIERLRARIDALMLEYCPGEMTAAQREEWAKHQRPSHEPKACETFPGEVHPLGKLTNLICDVIEHARDSSPHSNEFEALVQTMWDEYNAKLLVQGASRDASSGEYCDRRPHDFVRLPGGIIATCTYCGRPQPPAQRTLLQRSEDK